MSKKVLKLQDELDRLKKEIEQEEKRQKDLIEQTEKEINDILTERNLFCGVILDAMNLGEVVKVAASVKESVKIPFRLYFEETQEEEKK